MVFISKWDTGADSIYRCHLTSIGIPIVKIRQSYDCFISTIGFPILIRHLYIESDPICERTEIDPKSVTDGQSLPSGSWCNSYVPSDTYIYPRADSRYAPSQWETALQSSAVSHWLGTNLESALYPTRLTARNLDTDEASSNSFSNIKFLLYTTWCHHNMFN